MSPAKPESQPTNQRPYSYDMPDIEAGAEELWRQTKHDSTDWSWDQVSMIRKEAYRQITMRVLNAAGCFDMMKSAQEAVSGKP